MKRIIAAGFSLMFAGNVAASCGCQETASKPCEQETLASATAQQSQTFEMSLASDTGANSFWGGLIVAFVMWPFVWLIHSIRKRSNKLLLLALPRAVDQPSERLPLAA
jgi:hypothetical protein